MENASLLAEDAAQTGAARLHQNETDQTKGEDQFGNSQGIFQWNLCLIPKNARSYGLWSIPCGRRTRRGMHSAGTSSVSMKDGLGDDCGHRQSHRPR